jgi:hypothetical protein
VGSSDEVLRVAEKVAAAAVRHDGPDGGAWRRDFVLDAHYVQRSLPGAWLLHTREQLCETPELGTATGHGGSDHRCSLDAILPPAGDQDLARRGCQAPKHRMLDGLQNLLLGREPERYPTDVAFGLVRADDVWMAMVPGELTVRAGAMLQRAVGDVAGASAQVRVVGLSNGYVQYITTPWEYSLQRYEGGSTLYGPRSAQYFADQAEILARAVGGQRLDLEHLDEVRAPQLELAPEHHRLLGPGDGVAAAAMHTPRASRGVCLLPGADPVSVCSWWTDAAPGVVPIASRLCPAGSPPGCQPEPDRPWMELVKADGSPLLICETWPWLGEGAAPCDPAGTVDDRGVDFFTTVRGRLGDGYVWSTIFHPSRLEWAQLPPSGVRIRARAEGVVPVTTDAFSPVAMPAACTAEQAAMCKLAE